MAARFYFDLTDGLNTIPDEVGVLAADLEEAAEQAWVVLAELRAADELTDIVEGWVLIIRDASGGTLMTLPVVPRNPSAVLAS